MKILFSIICLFLFACENPYQPLDIVHDVKVEKFSAQAGNDGGVYVKVEHFPKSPKSDDFFFEFQYEIRNNSSETVECTQKYVHTTLGNRNFFALSNLDPFIIMPGEGIIFRAYIRTMEGRHSLEVLVNGQSYSDSFTIKNFKADDTL